MKKSIHTALKAGVAPLVLGTALLATPAFAADDTNDTKDTNTIVVTGTLLRRTSTETVSPVSTVTAESLEQRGLSTLQDGLQALAANNGPALTNSFTANGAFAAGASAVSLRGLSTNSTLVLFDGMRAAYYPLADDGSRNFVDLNTIPDDIVEKVDVLRDGASASYGADAIAGVVNVRTKREFKGLAGRAEAGISSRGDAGSRRFTITAGFGDLEEKGYNVYVSAGYYKSDMLKNSARGYPYNTADWSGLGNMTTGVVGGRNGDGTYTQGTPTSSIFYVRAYNAANSAATGSRYQALNAAQCAGSTTQMTAADLAGNPTAPLAGVCAVDYTNRYGVIQPAIERINASAHLTKKYGETGEAYLELNFIQSSSFYTSNPAVIRGSAPAGIFYKQFSTATSGPTYADGSGILALPAYVCARNGASATMVNGVPTVAGCGASNGTLNPNNPFAASGQVARIVGRDLGTPTTYETRNRGYRAAAGAHGQITDTIGYDVGATYMHEDLRRQQTGFVYIQHLLDAIADGSYNFVNPAANSQAVRDYVTPANINYATSDLAQFQGNINAKLFDLPGGPVQIAVGGSIHYEAVDAPSANSDAAGPTQRYFTLNAFGTKGSRWVEAAYYELAVPVVKQLELSTAGRFDNYSSGQNNFSPKFGVKIKPVKMLMLRGTYSKGFRIPSFGEANALPTTGYVTNSSANFTDAFLRQYGCSKATYSSCPTYITTSSYGQTSLASPNLQPEKSSSLNLGLVFEPVRNFSITVDYYAIEKTGVITQPSNTPALQAYYSGQPIPAGYTVIPGAPDSSGNFPNATPVVGFVQAQLVNANTQRVQGWDFSMDFRHKFGSSVRFSSHLEASYIAKLYTVFADGSWERYDGTLGNYNLTAGSGTPKWHGSWMNTFEFGEHYKVTGTVNYFSGYNLSAMDQGGTYMDNSLNPGYSPTGNNVPGYTTYDITGTIKVNDNFSIYGTILNLTDKMPPIDVVTYGAHGYNPVQGGNGILGRYFKVGTKFNF